MQNVAELKTFFKVHLSSGNFNINTEPRTFCRLLLANNHQRPWWIPWGTTKQSHVHRWVHLSTTCTSLQMELRQHACQHRCHQDIRDCVEICVHADIHSISQWQWKVSEMRCPVYGQWVTSWSERHPPGKEWVEIKPFKPYWFHQVD